MTARIDAIGLAAPPSVREQREIAENTIATMALEGDEARRVRALYKRSGIDRRAAVIHDDRLASGAPMGFMRAAQSPRDRGPTITERMLVYERLAPELALASARDAFAASAYSPDEISHLITVSCTGSAAPGVDTALIRGLGLRPDVARTNVGFMGCHGAINGLRAAKAFAESVPGSRILVTCVELCSLHYSYSADTEKKVTNAIFADGAASVLLTDDDASGPRISATASHFIPDTERDMSWSVRDHGFEMTLSPRVPELIEHSARDWLESWLGSIGLDVDSIGGWAVHPGGPKILTAAHAALDLKTGALDDSRAVLREHGNMSSPTVLFILKRMLDAGARGPIVALAFGPGLVIEAMLIDPNEPDPRRPPTLA